MSVIIVPSPVDSKYAAWHVSATSLRLCVESHDLVTPTPHLAALMTLSYLQILAISCYEVTVIGRMMLRPDEQSRLIPAFENLLNACVQRQHENAALTKVQLAAGNLNHYMIFPVGALVRFFFDAFQVFDRDTSRVKLFIDMFFDIKDNNLGLHPELHPQNVRFRDRHILAFTTWGAAGLGVNERRDLDFVSFGGSGVDRFYGPAAMCYLFQKDTRGRKNMKGIFINHGDDRGNYNDGASGQTTGSMPIPIPVPDRGRSINREREETPYERVSVRGAYGDWHLRENV